jgi:hypothetical protein
MNKIYLLHHGYHHNRYNWKKEIEEIKSIKPDTILCLCLEEFDYSYIYELFFDGIKEYLSNSNSIVKVLVPNPDNVTLFPKIVTESTCGYYGWIDGIFFKQAIKDDVVIDRVYTCYNNNPKFERALLIDKLASRHLLQHGIVTFKYPKVKDIFKDAMTGREFTEWQYHDGSRLVDEEEFELNTSAQFAPNAYPNSYFRGFFDLVTESCCYPDHFFFTEKTAKSINALKPFICLANPLYNTKFLVEEYGLELYDELFDYSFDKIHDLDKRIEMMVAEVERIVQVSSMDYITTMLKTIRPKLERNKQRLIDYGLVKENIVPRSFDFLFNDEPYELYGHVDELSGYTHYYINKGWL